MIHELEEQFDDRNMFLLAVLGLLSVRDHLARLTREYGKAATPTAVSPDQKRGEDLLLHAVLGAISITETVARHAAQAVAGAQVEAPVPPPAATLRRLLV